MVHASLYFLALLYRGEAKILRGAGQFFLVRAENGDGDCRPVCQFRWAVPPVYPACAAIPPIATPGGYMVNVKVLMNQYIFDCHIPILSSPAARCWIPTPGRSPFSAATPRSCSTPPDRWPTGAPMCPGRRKSSA